MHIPILETERLVLRPLTPEDAADMMAWASDPDVTRYLPYTRYTRVSDAEEWLRSIADEKNAYYCGIVCRNSSLLIGSASLTWNGQGNGWEFGYNLRKDHWGCGYATEALRAILRYGRDDLHAETFLAKHAVDNPASGRVMLKCGMKFDHFGEYTSLDGLRHFYARYYTGNAREMPLD